MTSSAAAEIPRLGPAIDVAAALKELVGLPYGIDRNLERGGEGANRRQLVADCVGALGYRGEEQLRHARVEGGAAVEPLAGPALGFRFHRENIAWGESVRQTQATIQSVGTVEAQSLLIALRLYS